MWNKNATLTSEQAYLSQAQGAKQKGDQKWHRGRRQKTKKEERGVRQVGGRVGGWAMKKTEISAEYHIILQAQTLTAAPQRVVQAAESKKQTLRSKG